MAKRRVNKNLVGIVTAAGVFLAVLVVAVAAYNASRRDPEAYARKALAQEEAGDWRRAIFLWQNAFGEEKEAKYLLEAARVARVHGELGVMFNQLNLAYRQSPEDVDVLATLLQRYWEIRDMPMGASHWEDVLERADSLLQIKPENALALASKLEAAEWLRMREEEAAKYTLVADETYEIAQRIDPTDPYIALATAQRGDLRSNEKARRAMTRERFAEMERVLADGRAERVAALLPATQAHPENIELRLACAQALTSLRRWDEAGRLLGEGLTRLERDRQADDPDLHYELARVIYQETQQAIEEATQAVQPLASGEPDRERIDIAACNAIDNEKISRALEHAAAAIAAEPALYGAYRLQADLQRLLWVDDGKWKNEPKECQRVMLELYAKALNDTVSLESMRAVLAKYRQERLGMISSAFDAALSFYRAALTEDVRAQALTYLHSFLQAAQAQYPDQAQTNLMAGYISQINGETRLAVKAFTEAEKQAEKNGGSSMSYAWLAREELSRAYSALGELGLALQYTNQIIDYQQSTRRNPPRRLEAQRIDLLLALNRNQEALNHIERLMRLNPDWTSLKAVRARALTALDRGEQAVREIGELASDNPRFLLEQAHIAAANGEYESAADKYGQYLENDPDNAQVIERLATVLEAGGRKDDALRFIRDKLETVTNEHLRRSLMSREIMLTESDPAAREQKQLDLIGAIADEYERLASFLNYWRARGEIQHSQHYLDQMEKLRPDDVEIKRLQFDAALQLKDCRRAERYSVALVNANADQVGGAMFRGRYELTCGNSNRALTEFRAAERDFPRDSELKRYIARALMNLSPPRYEEAIQALIESIEFDPSNIDARKLIYACYEVIGRREEGIPHLDRAVEMAARLGIEDEFINQHAQLLVEEKDPRRGIAEREKMRAAQPRDTANLLRLAELYDKIGDVDSARERLSEAAAIDPGDFSIARFGARFYSQHNNPAGGEALLEQHLQSQTGLNEIVARILIAQFHESLSNTALRLRGEQPANNDETRAKELVQSAQKSRQKALDAYLNARQRSAELTGCSEEDRRRAVEISLAELGRFYQRIGRWEDMIDAYRTLLSRLDKDDVEAMQNARLNVVAGLRAMKKYGEAREEIASFRREYPNNLGGITAEVELLMTGGEQTDAEQAAARTKARELLTRVVTNDPGNAWSWYMRGLIGKQQERYTDARDDLLEAKALAPLGFNLKHRLDLVDLYELMGKPELAEAELRELMRVEHAGSRNVQLRLIQLLQRTNQVERAMEFVSQMKAEDPKQAFWPYQLGMLLSERGEYSAAASEMQKAAELTEYKNAKTIEDWLEILNKAQRSDDVVRVYENLPLNVLSPELDVRTPAVKAAAAAAYWEQGRREIARALLEQAVHAAAANQRGVQLLRGILREATKVTGRDEVLAMIRRIRDSASEIGSIMSLRIALAEYLASDTDETRRNEGLKIIDEVLSETDPDSPLYFEMLSARAITLDQVGRTEEAAAVYERGLEIRPNDLRSLNNLAYLLADKLNRPQEALPYARRMEETGSDNATLLDTVGWVYFKAGFSEQAMSTLREAVRLDPSYTAAHYHLGLVFAELNRTDEARSEFMRVQELARENKTTDYVKEAEAALAKLR